MTLRNRILVSMLAALAWQSSALAGLGANIRSIALDREALHGTSDNVSTQQQYSQHTITTDGGTAINEYANPQGTVFAVTWRGPMPPDLKQLFGTYYDQYQGAATESANSHSGGHRRLSIAKDDLVVQAVGRQRYYHGRAYVRSLVPAGVSVEDLQ